MKMIPIINCVKTSVSIGELEMCESNDLYLRVFTFWFDTEKALFQVILGCYN